MLNRIRTTILLALMTAFILWIGDFLGGRQGMVIALLLAGVMNLSTYWFSDRIVLRMYGAQPITPDEAPKLYQMVERLTQRANLLMPTLCIIPDDSPNAFATGRNPDHAVVAVTEGLLNLLNENEIEGVIAHELAHVKNRDTLIGAIAATMAGAVMVLANIARFSAFFGGSLLSLFSTHPPLEERIARLRRRR